MTLQSVQMGTPDAVVIKRTTKVVDASTAVSKRINASATADADAVTAVTEDLAHSDVEQGRDDEIDDVLMISMTLMSITVDHP